MSDERSLTLPRWSLGRTLVRRRRRRLPPNWKWLVIQILLAVIFVPVNLVALVGKESGTDRMVNVLLTVMWVTNTVVCVRQLSREDGRFRPEDRSQQILGTACWMASVVLLIGKVVGW